MLKSILSTLFVSVLWGLLLTTPTGCNRPADPVTPQATVLVKNDLVATYTADQLKARYTGSLALLGQFVRYGVKVYKLTYTTTNTDGKALTASGLLLVPDATTKLPLVSYQHGTILTNADAPSNYQPGSEVYEFTTVFASLGYIISAPDYIGYGVSASVPHTYEHRSGLATASLDMLRASREFIGQQNLNWDNRLLLTGYSEGGYATLALQKKMEEEVPTEFNLVGSSCGAGAYDKPAFVRYVAANTTQAANNRLYLFVLQTYARIYTPTRPYSYYVKEPYATQLASKSAIDITVPGSFNTILTDSFKQAILNKTDAEFEAALADNDIHDWKPRTPTQLYHGDADNTVFFFNSQNTYDAMRKRGATNVALIPIAGATHVSGIQNYILGTSIFFQSL
jgi:alpha-beta hydrolase superfamily lysophospholipase